MNTNPLLFEYRIEEVIMELSVAMVLFLLKTGIKHLDGNYSTQDFIVDVFNAFGEKTGNKLNEIIKKSHYEINSILNDQNLSAIGIDCTRTALVRSNVMEILKQIKITNTMLNDYDCSATEITNCIISNYSDHTINPDDIVLRDIKRALFEIVKIHVNIAKKDSGFITDIIIDTHKYSKKSYKGIESIKSDTLTIIAMLNDFTTMYYASQQQALSSRATQNEEVKGWSPNNTEKLERIDPKTINALIDLSKGGQGNGKFD